MPSSVVIAKYFSFVLKPDVGYIFVFHKDGRQLFHEDGRAVQVLAIYANS